MKRQVIAVDIDDVMSASAAGFAAFSNKRWGHALTVDDYQEDWAVVWGVSLEEAIRRAEEFHISGVVGGYNHEPEAVDVLRMLAERYRLVVVTSRRQVLKPETDVWLSKYFPGVFSEVRYAGMWDKRSDVTKQLAQTKAEICRELGASYLIDDQIKHCVSAARAGVQALLFGTYAWNQTNESLPAGITRVANWQEVKEFFDAQSRR